MVHRGRPGWQRRRAEDGPRRRTAPFGLAGRFDDDAPSGAAHDGAIVAVLATPADWPTNWLSAGRALQHVLLLAATAWVFADIDNQALEGEGRRAVEDVLTDP